LVVNNPERDDMPTITCAKCGDQKEGFVKAPFPGAMGARILDGTCQECWQLWLKQQTMLINHYGLNVMDPQARQFLTRNMEAFLFKGGRQDDVDTTKQGQITY
jgi:Fe-S cluster biosynthesis and repair protein YggX